MLAMMECRVCILNEVLQIFKLKNFRFRMGLWPPSFLAIGVVVPTPHLV